MRTILGAVMAITLGACGDTCPENSHFVILGDGGAPACEADCGYQPVGQDASQGFEPLLGDVCSNSATHTASAVPVVDGGGACDSPNAIESCGAAVAEVAACCEGLDDYQSRSAVDFCEYLGLNTATPTAACKTIAQLDCASVIDRGLCY